MKIATKPQSALWMIGWVSAVRINVRRLKGFKYVTSQDRAPAVIG